MAEREMTGIEALEELINMIPKEKHINSIHNNKIDILKYNVLKFLDRLETLEKENQGVKDDNTRLWHSLECANNENAKLKKALNILINKQVYIYGIKSLSSVNQYNNIIIRTSFDKLVKEEYELLKQVFESIGGKCD